MVKFLIPSHLFDLVSKKDQPAERAPLTTVSLNPGSWEEIVAQIRQLSPPLAERVFTESGTIAAGFILAVNDNVVQKDYVSLHFNSGDEICIIAAMAGG